MNSFEYLRTPELKNNDIDTNFETKYAYQARHSPLRGEMYYIVDNPNRPSVGKEIWSNRVGLVVSQDQGNKHSGFVQVVYLSTSARKRIGPTHIPIWSGSKPAMALCEQIYTVDNSRLKTCIGKATDEEMQDVSQAMMFGLGINFGTSPQGIFHKWENMIVEYNLGNEYEKRNFMPFEDSFYE